VVLVSFGIGRPIFAVDSIIKTNATVGSSFQTIGTINSTGALVIQDVTFSDGTKGITRVDIELYTTSGTCAPYMRMSSDRVTPTNMVESSNNPTITTTPTMVSYTFTPTYSANNTATLYWTDNCSSTVRAKHNSPTQSWGSATYQGLGANNAQIPKVDIYGDTFGGMANPLLTIVYPVDGTEYGSTGVPYRYASNICVVDFPNKSFSQYTTFEVDSDKTGGETWGAYGTFESTSPTLYTAASYADPDCISGLTYGFGTLGDASYPTTFAAGHYRVKAKIKEVGGSYGTDSAWTEFTVSSFSVGGGGGGSWSGGDSGSQEDWETANAAVWATRPTCTIISFDFLGTSSGDGMECVGDWLKFYIVPPTDTMFNFVAYPMSVLESRWPFAYFTQFYTHFTSSVKNPSTSCPLPQFASVEFGDSGQSTPAIDPCDFVSPIAGYIENTTFETYIVWLTYLGFVGYCLAQAREFFSA